MRVLFAFYVIFTWCKHKAPIFAMQNTENFSGFVGVLFAFPLIFLLGVGTCPKACAICFLCYFHLA